MAKVRITLPEQRPWQQSDLREPSAAAMAQMPDGGPASGYKLREPGSAETPQLVECLRVMEKRRAALEQQREDIEAMLAEIGQFDRLCRAELARRERQA